MMKQIFVVHTQYNLILAIGLAKKEDDLILFQDFELTDLLKMRLKKRFDRCLFLTGNYPNKELSVREKERKIREGCKAIKKFINSVYDQIFIVDDMCIPEMYALKCVYKLNNQTVMSWLEDGAIAYYSNDVISGGMGGTVFKRMIRKAYFTLHYGLWGFYDLATCMGAHQRLSKVYLTFPGHAREELNNKEQCPITEDQFKEGINIMYGAEAVDLEEDSVLIAIDKLDVYGDKFPVVNAEMQNIVNQAFESGKKVYCKYHPRETQRMDALSKVTELNSKTAMEYYLANATVKKMLVVGVMSTALQTAKKMGFDVISLAASVGINQNVIDFYRSIGIKVK